MKMKKFDIRKAERTTEGIELFHFTVGDGIAYPRYYIPTVRQINERTQRNGRYNQTMAQNDFLSCAYKAAELYVKEYCTPGDPVYRIFNTRSLVCAASLLTIHYEMENELALSGLGRRL